MDAETTVREYYGALRDGDPLAPFFLDAPSVVKFGLSERLSGHDEVAAGLREQTRTTTDWTVGSSNLLAEARGDAGWFSDDVFLAWTDVERGIRYEFDTRWSGTLVRVDEGPGNGDGRGTGSENGEGRGRGRGDGSAWRFAGMHVSTVQEGI